MEKLEKDGIWWVPGLKKKHHPGRLRFSRNEGASLELTIQNPPTGITGFADEAILLGTSSEGQAFTLVDCTDFGGRTTDAGVGTRKFRPWLVIRGAYFPRIAAARFSEVRVSYRLLPYWLLRPSISVTQSRDNSSISAIYVKPSDIVLPIWNDLTLVIESSPFPCALAASWSGSYTLRESYWVSIRSSQARSLDFFLEAIHTLQDFFSLACLQSCPPDTIELVPSGSRKKAWQPAELYFESPDEKRNLDSPHPTNCIFQFEDIAHAPDKFFRSWMDISAQLKTVRSAYASALSGQHRYIDSEFIDIVRAAEVFHTRFRMGRYLDKERFDSEVLPAIAAAVPGHLPKEFREAAKGKLAYLNEYSLGKRLKALYRENRTIVDHFIPKPERVIADCVKYRNHFTHHSGELGESMRDAVRIARCSDFLKLLVEMALLTEIGFNADDRLKLSKKCWVYRVRYHPKNWQ